MARPPRIDVPEALYHVLARGNQRRTIFRDASDYRRYSELLARYQQRHGFTLYAYVLMPNHLHLLLSPGQSPPTSPGKKPVSRSTRRLATSGAMRRP